MTVCATCAIDQAPSDTATANSYDGPGNLASLTDANSHSTQNVFNVFSDITGKTLPDGSLQESRAYDASGNLTQLTHFSGKTTTYAYDALNRLTTRTPDPTLVTEPVVSYTYTPTGKYASTTVTTNTAPAITTYAYDLLDRLTTKVTPEGTLNYTFDLAGNVASIYSSSVHGASMSYTYDSLNRLSTVVDNNLPAGSNTTIYAYDTASNLVTVTYPNKLQSTIQYDSLNRLTSLNTATQNSSAVAGYSYTLGATGNRIGATEQTGRTLTWNYDGIYRLTSEAVQDPSGGNGEVDYTLDPVGNRTSATSSLPGVQSVTLNSFNLDDWLSPETYDANGNTLTTGGKSICLRLGEPPCVDERRRGYNDLRRLWQPRLEDGGQRDDEVSCGGRREPDRPAAGLRGVGQRRAPAHLHLRPATHQREPANPGRMDAQLLRLRRLRKRTPVDGFERHSNG